MRISLIALLTLACTYSFAQGTFNKVIQPTAQVTINDAMCTQTGQFVNVGTHYQGPYDENFIVKLNGQGDTVWAKNYQDQGNSGIFNVSEYPSGRYYLVGTQWAAGGFNGAAGVMQLDSNGAVLWDKAILTNFPGNYHFLGPVRTTLGGQDAYVGYCEKYQGAGNDTGWVHLAKLDRNGDTIWTKKLHLGVVSSSFTIQGAANDIIVAANGDVIYSVVLGSGGGAAGLKQYLIRMTSTGNVVYVKSFNYITVPSFTVFDLKELSSGDIVLTGRANGFAGTSFIGTGIIVFDASGNFKQSYVYNVGGTGMDLIEGPGASMYLAIRGSNSAPDGFLRNMILKLDAAFQPVWASLLGGIQNQEEVRSINWTPDNHLYIAGYSRGFGANTTIKPTFTKMDTNGVTSSCYLPHSQVLVQPFSMIWNNEVPTVHKSYGVTNTSIVASGQPLGITYDLSVPLTDSIIPPLCTGDQGTIDITMQSPHSPFIYAWSNGASSEDNTDYAGTYSLVVRDAQGCYQTDSFTIVDPPVLNASYTRQNVTCFGASDGSIDLTVTGGTPGYSFAWTTLDVTEDLNNIPGGFYQVTITDTNGCQKIVGIAVTEPQQLIAVITNTKHASCNGVCDGELASLVNGGTQPYQLVWNDPLNQTGDTATGLCAGQYLLTVTDTNGCNAYANGTITEPQVLTGTITSSGTACGANNGQANVTPTGGSPGYQYQWSSGSTTAAASNLGLQTYTVIVTDTNGCTFQDSVSIQGIVLGQDLCVITVNDTNQNLLVWEKPVSGNIDGYFIYRNISGAYSKVGFHDYDSLSQFVDLSFGVNPTVTSYRYKLSVLDTCGNESDLSPHHETIHLTANIGVGGEVNLIWDDYEGKPFNSYIIMLDSTDQGNFFALDTVPSTNFTYTDWNPPTDSATYIIQVSLDSTCTSKANYNTTRSNELKPKAAPSGIDADVLYDAIKIAPNPSNGQFNVQLPYRVQEVDYLVYDMQGHMVTNGTSVNNVTFDVNIEDLANGIYVLKLQLEQTVLNYKVAKQ